MQRQSSAGGVVYRLAAAGSIEVVLIATQNGERWGLPKGTIARGEEPEAAAVREVREETGLDSRVVQRLDTIDYWFSVQRGGRRGRVHKSVHFFLMEALGGDVADHDHEVDEARWFALDAAIEVASYQGEREMLRRARAALAATR